MNVTKLLAALMLLVVSLASSGGTITAQSTDWNEVPSVATDPRDDWVVLEGPDEGQTHAAICRENDLDKVGMNSAGWVITWSVSDDPMCAEDAPPANLDPMRFQDPRLSWVIMPGEPGRTYPARCHDGNYYSVEESLATGELKWKRFASALACDNSAYKA